MANLLYLYLVFILRKCILNVKNGKLDLLFINAEDDQLGYYGGSQFLFYFPKNFQDEKRSDTYRFIPNCLFAREIILIAYKLSLKRDFLTAKDYNSGLLLLIKRETHIEYIAPKANSCKKGTQKNYNGRTKDKTNLLCGLHCFDIGVLRSCKGKCDNVYENIGQQLYIYIAFIKSKELDNLKIIPKNNANEYVFSIAFCPSAHWAKKARNKYYHRDGNNTTDTVEMGDYDDKIFLKLAYCHNYDIYKCLKCKEPKVYKIYNNNQERKDMAIMSNNKPICDEKILFKRKHETVFVLVPENNCNKSDTLELNIASVKPNLYLAQRLQIENIINIGKNYPEATTYLIFAVNYVHRCILPYSKLRLYLKINYTIQNFEYKTDGNFGVINVYVVERGGIDNVPVGCHVIFDEKRHPTLNDFYEYCCQSSLLTFDGKTNNFKEVFDIQSMEPNKKYICDLKVKNAISTSGKQNHIHETEFTIHLIDSDFVVWAIFGVSITILLVLIVGLIIFKKSQLRKKESGNSLSTSASSSQLPSTTSTIISNVSNVLIIRKKNAATTYANMAISMVTKNLNTNNKMTGVRQKVVGKNSNLNLINQTKKAPKRIAAKLQIKIGLTISSILFLN